MSPQEPDLKGSVATDPGLVSAPTRIDVAELTKGAREITLVHEGQEYRLRITAKGKLILTK